MRNASLKSMTLAALALALVFGGADVASAKETKAKQKKSAAKPTRKAKAKALQPLKGGLAGGQSEGKLSTDIVFDGASVNGKYHSAGEAVARVETEKDMNELIGMRRDFKDRLQAERTRLKRGEAAEGAPIEGTEAVR